MELVIKTKGEPFAQLEVYNWDDAHNDVYSFNFKHFLDVECSQIFYTLSLVKIFKVKNTKTYDWEDQTAEKTFNLTTAQCDTDEQYLKWLNTHIEFILVNGTFFFQCQEEEAQNQVIIDEPSF